MPRQLKGARKDSKLWETRNLDEHVGLIKRQVEKSLVDPETRQLAVQIVSCAFDYAKDRRRNGDEVAVVEAWGKKFRIPNPDVCPRARDARGEITAVWNFVVANFRYVYDPTETDFFATAKYSLEAGGGDCDDATIVFAALLKSLGFYVAARVVSTKSNPGSWVHVYPIVGFPKDNPREWIALDMTVEGFKPGDQYNEIARHQDYML